MEQIELRSVIEEAIAKFSRNRIGDKPPVFLMIPSTLRVVPWRDRTLKELVRVFLYETLLTSDPDATVEISLRRRAELKDLDPFVGVTPSYWLQLRISGRGFWNGSALAITRFRESMSAPYIVRFPVLARPVLTAIGPATTSLLRVNPASWTLLVIPTDPRQN